MKMRWATFSVMAVLVIGGAKQVWGLQQAQHGQPQYNEHDRQATKDWYNQHGDKAPIGLRAQDRKPAYEQQLQPGSVLSAPLRRIVHPVPPELARNLSKPPSGYRHVAVGGHIALIDRKYHVYDVIHPEQ
jgi:Ni/Co efflux regulator RcnB